MAMPTYQAIGTAVEGTGDVTAAWPTHAVGDVALLVIESAGGEAANLALSPGWAAVTNSPQSALTGTSGTRITVYWNRATTTSMPTATVTDPGNHVAAVIVTFRGCVASGNPWDVTAGDTKATASTSDTLPAVTTTVIDCLIVLLATRNAGTGGGAWSGTYTNAGLGSITERLNGAYASGNGGGILIVTGTKAVAGSTGTTSATLGASQTCAYLTVALRPVRQGGAITGSASASTSNTGLKAGLGAITGSASASTVPAGRKHDGGAITGSAAAATSLTGRKRGKGALTGNAEADNVVRPGHRITGSAWAYSTIVGNHPGGGTIVGSADAHTTLTGRKVAVGAVTGTADADTSIVGRHVPLPVGYVQTRNPPGAVWRLGKIGGGDDYGKILMHVVEWGFECAFEPEPLGGTFVYPAAEPGPDGDLIDTSDFLYPGAEIAVILGGEERRNCRFTIHDPVDEILKGEDGRTISHTRTWTLLNMFHRLRSYAIAPADGVPVLRPKEWQGVTAGEPPRFVMHQAHVDGSLDELGFDFETDVDSNEAPYQFDVDLTVDRGVLAIDVIRSLWDMHVWDIWFERRKLRIFNPDSMSQNYAGSGTKIIVAGYAGDLLEAPRTIYSQDRATRVLVRGDEDRYAYAALDPDDFTDLDTHTGYLDVTKDAAGTKDPVELARIAGLYLEQLSHDRRQITYVVNLGAGKDPLIHYQLGDWIMKHDGTETDGLPEKVRVLRCFYTGDQSGVLTAGVTVEDWFGDLETRTQRKIDGITGGLPGAAHPSRTSVPPAAPTNVVATFDVVPPASGSGGKNWIHASLTWDWSGLDEDGPLCGDFDKFLIRWKYGTHGWTVLDGTDETTDEIPRLDPGKDVTIQVGARDEAGNVGWSEDATT